MLLTEPVAFETCKTESKTLSFSSLAWVLVVTVSLVGLAILREGPQKTTALAIGAGPLLVLILAFHGLFLLQLRSRQRNILSKLRQAEHENLLAEKELAANRILVQSTSAEADVLRNSTTTLTQDPPLDSFLAFLLRDLAGMVPCQAAQILIKDDDNQLISMCEKAVELEADLMVSYPSSIDLNRFPLWKRVLKGQMAEVLSQTPGQEESTTTPLPASMRSCLVAPLIAGSESIGMIWAGSSHAEAFTPGHLRTMVSVANSATVAIQNARLRERAEILGLELSGRVSDLEVQRSENLDKIGQFSDETFRTIFQASPIAISITTIKEDRFVDVNKAFEARYGYSRSELIGRTTQEIQFWEDKNARTILSSELRRGAVRNLLLTQRAKTGELKVTCLSANRIRLEEEEFVLAISGEVPMGSFSVN